jgi:hypothetical protein
VKPLEPVFASPIENLQLGGHYQNAVASSYHTAEGALTSYASPAIENAAYVSSASYEQGGSVHTSPPIENIRYDGGDQSSYPMPAVENNYQTDVDVAHHHAPPPEVLAREGVAPTVYETPGVENYYQSELPHPVRQTPPAIEPPPPDSYEHSYEHNYSNNYRNTVEAKNSFTHDARQNAIYNSVLGIQNTPVRAPMNPPPAHNPDTIKKIIDDLKNAAGETHVDQPESETWQSWAEW